MDSTNSPKPEDARRDEFARHMPWVAAGAVLVVAVPLGLLRGAPAVVLWLAFAALATAVLLFWETLRVALDPNAPGDAATLGEDEGLPIELEARKRAAMRALRDLEFERAIHRLNEEDYKALEQKYRAEARSAMRAIDEGLGAWLDRADAMLATKEGAAEETSPQVSLSAPEALSQTPPPTPLSLSGEGEPERNAPRDRTPPSPDRERGDGGVRSEESGAESVSTAQTPAKSTCPQCATSNDVDAVFCKKCGTRIAEAATQEKTDAS